MSEFFAEGRWVGLEPGVWGGPDAMQAERFGAERIRCSSAWQMAQALVGKRYGQRGLQFKALDSETPGLASVRVLDGEQVVGALSVRMDGAEGLSADSVFPEVMADLRRNQRLCEFTRLAVDGGTEPKPVLARLFHLAYLFAHRLEKAELMVFEVHPRHAAFYRRMLGVHLLADERLNPHVQAPAVLMGKPASEIRSEIQLLGGRPELAAKARSLYPLFYGASEEARLLRDMQFGAL